MFFTIFLGGWGGGGGGGMVFAYLMMILHGFPSSNRTPYAFDKIHERYIYFNK